MPYLNTYAASQALPEEDYHLNTPLEEYDLNFQYSVKPLQRSYLQKDVKCPDSIRLEPLIPSLHAKQLFEALQEPEHDAMFRYLYYGPWSTLTQLLTFLEAWRRDSSRTLFIIYDLSSGDKRVAGFIGYLDGIAIDLRAEIGAVTIIKAFQRTHVTSHAVGILMEYCLGSKEEDCLSLRRCWWKCNADNVASSNCALRLGMQLDGISKYGRSIEKHKDGVELPETDLHYGQPDLSKGRHDAILAITFDDWLGIGSREGFNGREHLRKLLDRPVASASLQMDIIQLNEDSTALTGQPSLPLLSSSSPIPASQALSTAYANSYADQSIPETDYHILTPLNAYDLNFAFPLQPLQRSFLQETPIPDAVRLEPLIVSPSALLENSLKYTEQPSLHAKALRDALGGEASQELFRFFSVGPFTRLNSFLTLLETWRRDPHRTVFVVLDLSKGKPQVAGMIGFCHADPANLMVELAAVVICKEFHGTHVATQACALLLLYCFESLKCRRCSWGCHVDNAASKKCALRLGFQSECTSKFAMVFPFSKAGVTLPDSDGDYGRPEAGKARHDDVLALCCDDWIGLGRENFIGREHIRKLLDRPVEMKGANKS